MSGVYVIAEAGVNHNGDLRLAFKLIDSAVESGANAIKFQTFKTENLVTKNALKANYQKRTTSKNESQFSMLKNLEITNKDHYKLVEYCNNKGIKFLSTAFDLESLNFLVNDLGLDVLKISSGEITNSIMLLACARTNCDLIISTGMSTLGEIEDALSVISFGLIYGKNMDVKPSHDNFRLAYMSQDGQELLKKKVTLLHCTTEYPAPLNDINLKSMITINNSFGLKVGFSDHSKGILAPIVATSIGAVLIEKHFTLDKTLPGPDHASSLNPIELKKMVESIRVAEKILGNGVKGPKISELNNLETARKSIVAASSIKKGDFFTKDNITSKRPATGISPMKYWDLLGTKCQSDYESDEVIR